MGSKSQDYLAIATAFLLYLSLIYFLGAYKIERDNLAAGLRFSSSAFAALAILVFL